MVADAAQEIVPVQTGQCCELCFWWDRAIQRQGYYGTEMFFQDSVLY